MQSYPIGVLGPADNKATTTSFFKFASLPFEELEEFWLSLLKSTPDLLGYYAVRGIHGKLVPVSIQTNVPASEVFQQCAGVHSTNLSRAASPSGGCRVAPV